MLSDIFTPSGTPSNDTAVTIAALIISQVVQSLWLKWVGYLSAKKIKEDLRIKAEKERKARIRAARRTAKVTEIATESLSINKENSIANKDTTEKINKVYESVNGNGIGGQMKLVIGSLQDVVLWQDEHEKKDCERQEQILTKLDQTSDQIHARLAINTQTIADDQQRIDSILANTKESPTTTLPVVDMTIP